VPLGILRQVIGAAKQASSAIPAEVLPYVWHDSKDEMGRCPHCKLGKRRCSGAFLIFTLLVAMTSHATSQEASPSCKDGKVVAAHAGAQTQSTTPSAGSPGIRLTWDPSASPKSTVAGYNILRRELDPSCEGTLGKCGFKPLNPHTPIAGTTCTDYEVQTGHTYVYEAQTVGKDSKLSPVSNQATAKAR